MVIAEAILIKEDAVDMVMAVIEGQIFDIAMTFMMDETYF